MNLDSTAINVFFRVKYNMLFTFFTLFTLSGYSQAVKRCHDCHDESSVLAPGYKISFIDPIPSSSRNNCAMESFGPL
jgi:hypothetical protein